MANKGRSSTALFSSFYSTPQAKALAGARAEFWIDPRESVKIRGQRSVLLRRFRFGVFTAEALDAAGGVHELLLAGEERVAIRANFNADVAFMGRASHECIAARTMHANFVISWMNSCFHNSVAPAGPNLDSNH